MIETNQKVPRIHMYGRNKLNDIDLNRVVDLNLAYLNNIDFWTNKYLASESK